MLLAGDIGGTKTALGVFSVEQGAHKALAESEVHSADYKSLESIAQEFLAKVGLKIDCACFGVAGPVIAGRAKITNLPWIVDQASIAKDLNLEAVHLLNDLEAMANCRGAPEICAPATMRFIAVIDAARGLDGRARLDAVNRAVNGAIRYMTDMEQHGVEDLWSSPLATFTTGLGDCEDYAIAKYVALRQAGVAAGDLRIVLARDLTLREDHAVLAARLDGRWVILDNRRAELVDDNAVRNLMPLFAINHQGVQMFAAPYADRTPEGQGADVVPSTADPAFGAGGAGTRPVLM